MRISCPADDSSASSNGRSVPTLMHWRPNVGSVIEAMGDRGRLALPVFAIVTCLGVASGVGGAARAELTRSVAAPRTLVALTVPISQFAQDGSHMAWMTGRCKSYEKPVDYVALRAVSAGPRHVLAPKVWVPLL